MAGNRIGWLSIKVVLKDLCGPFLSCSWAENALPVEASHLVYHNNTVLYFGMLFFYFKRLLLQHRVSRTDGRTVCDCAALLLPLLLMNTEHGLTSPHLLQPWLLLQGSECFIVRNTTIVKTELMLPLKDKYPSEGCRYDYWKVKLFYSQSLASSSIFYGCRPVVWGRVCSSSWLITAHVITQFFENAVEH